MKKKSTISIPDNPGTNHSLALFWFYQHIHGAISTFSGIALVYLHNIECTYHGSGLSTTYIKQYALTILRHGSSLSTYIKQKDHSQAWLWFISIFKTVGTYHSLAWLWFNHIHKTVGTYHSLAWLWFINIYKTEALAILWHGSGLTISIKL